MVLHCFLGWAVGYLGQCVCWVDSYDFVCWVSVQGGTYLLGTSGFSPNGAADVEDFLLLRLCCLGYIVRHSLSCCMRRVVPNNTNPHDLKKKKNFLEVVSFPCLLSSPFNTEDFPHMRDLISIFILQYKNSLSLRFSPELLSSILIP